MSNIPNVNVGMQPHMPMSASHPTVEPVDPITKFKMLVPHLKESLQKVMANAAMVFSQNAQFDNANAQKSSGVVSQRFDRSLEEFYAICDQVELNLKLAIEVLGINSDIQRNVVLQMPAGQMKFPGGAGAAPGVAASSDLQTYTQFQAIVKAQVSCAKEIHDALSECARRLGEKPSQPQS